MCTHIVRGPCRLYRLCCLWCGWRAGVPQVGREDEFSINRQQMNARIWVCMGGTVAEELIFGRDQVSSGATDDLRQVDGRAGGWAGGWVELPGR